MRPDFNLVASKLAFFKNYMKKKTLSFSTLMFFWHSLHFEGHQLLTNQIRYIYNLWNLFSTKIWTSRFCPKVWNFSLHAQTDNFCFGNYDFTLNCFWGSFVTRNYCPPYFYTQPLESQRQDASSGIPRNPPIQVNPFNFT